MTKFNEELAKQYGINSLYQLYQLVQLYQLYQLVQLYQLYQLVQLYQLYGILCGYVCEQSINRQLTNSKRKIATMSLCSL
jgi:sulfur relay (sulfurtransferase) DsrF/TusC family protein